MTLSRRILVEKRRYIYPILAGVVLNAALFLAVVLPLSRKVSGGELQAEASAAALAQARRDHAAARATVSGKVDADAELKKFYGAVLPASQSAARTVTFLRINQIARDADVKIDRGSSDSAENQRRTERDRASELGKLSMSYVVVGEYADIRHFIHELETAPEFLILENVALTQGSEDTNELIVNMVVATYYRSGAHGN